MSRQQSARGSSAATASRGGASAAAQRRPGVLVQSPKSDIYVALLGLSLAAILIACLLMLLLLNSYGWSVKATA